MRRFLFASHAYLAKGILSSLELIMGRQDDVDIMCAYTEDDFDIKTEIDNRLNLVDKEDELIVITDVFGGSVNNEFMEKIANSEKRIYLVAGLNLPLVMNLIGRKDEDVSTKVLIEDCIEEAKSMILLCNNLLENTDEIEDEDF